jgi:hypothetical protein
MAALGTYDTYAGFYAQTVIDQTPPDSAFLREFYRLLFAYYQTNGLYTYLNQQLQATLSTNQLIKPLRNPAWRIVEFYASKLFPGALPDALPIKTDNDALTPAIEQLWQWSNFGSTKQKWARWFAIYGDWYLKVATRAGTDGPDSVYLTIIKPEHVTGMELDERGFLTWIRIDVENDDDDETVYTEIWSKEAQEMWLWPARRGTVDDEFDDLGSPTEVFTFEELTGEDFIPIVYQPFRYDGAGRCGGAYTAQLEKIDEVNRQATRLAQILFRYNRALWVATTQNADSSGRPLPPVDLSAILESDGSLKFDDDDILALPAMSDLKSLVPQINFADALAVLESQLGELAKDLPELVYYELRDMGELSGRAVKFLLDDMISRVVEARGNAEAGLIRAQQMALTIGQNLGLFEDLGGDYASGALDHQFDERPILPEDRQEVAQLITALTQAGASLFAAARAAGMSEDEAQALAQVDLFGLEGVPARLGVQTAGAPPQNATGAEFTATEATS